MRVFGSLSCFGPLMRLVWPTARTFFTRRCVWWQLTRTEFLYVYRVIIYVVIAQIPTAQILSRFVKHLAFFSYQTDICFVIWPVHFTGPLAHSFFFSFLIDLVGEHATVLKRPPRSRRPVAKRRERGRRGRCLRRQPGTSRSILITHLALFIFQLCSWLDFILILQSFLN